MLKKAGRPRQGESLTRERVVEAAIELLDLGGEEGLTFRALSERLATGAGAIYWHIANKSDLLAAACDAVVERAIDGTALVTSPEEAIRAVALGIFDAIDEHPWVGSAITSSLAMSSVVCILEPLGQQVRALRVPDAQQWTAVSTLMAYILGVSKQNAANGHLARTRGLDRLDFLNTVAAAWSQLDHKQHPFVRSIAKRLPEHDDRVDFIAGVEVILKGIDPARRRSRS